MQTEELLIMQQEIRFATFNVCNLAPPGVKLYDNLDPTTSEEYEAKLAWTAHQIDMLAADVIGFQEVFSQAALAEAVAHAALPRSGPRRLRSRPRRDA
jgi:predicted extracellular nuclease